MTSLTHACCRLANALRAVVTGAARSEGSMISPVSCGERRQKNDEG
jgi:hypothetical protein